MAEFIETTHDNGIAIIYFNRPDKRNAFNDQMRAEYLAALTEVGSDPSVKAVVLTGRGKGFCAGGDIAGMKQRLTAPPGNVAFNGWSRQQRVHQVQALLMNMPKPTIAAVNGAASGLGADTALACDFIMASPDASFTWSYILRGLIPDGGGMYFLPRRIGLTKAKELIFSGRRILAAEAISLGIADRLSSETTLIEEATHWARELGAGSSTALALGKGILNQSSELSAQQVFAMGSQAQSICYTSEQHQAAVVAFLDKSASQSSKS
jgi:enoyl-CoA hydratase/carnithine racemase